MDKTTSTHNWSKRIALALDRLNKDCNTTAGLEAVLRVAVGAHVLLRCNINTGLGLVNGAIGTVVSITQQKITVKFDNMEEQYEVEVVRSRFLLMRSIFIYK